MSLKARLKALEARAAAVNQDKPIRFLMFTRCFVPADSPLRGTIDAHGNDRFDVFYYTDQPYFVHGETDEFDALVDVFVKKQDRKYKYVVFKPSKPVGPNTYTLTNF